MTHRMMSTFAACAFALLLEVRSAAGADVSTLAGAGERGTTDGAANAASFAIPLGVAVAPSGGVYVADAGGQRVRLVKDGVVTTVAGSGAVRGNPQWPVAGGFADGPAAQAQFSRPSGVAVLRDGTVLVADAANYCIRAIRSAVVSTFAGTCAVSVKPVDGTRASARFGYVRGLAVDGGDNVFVADFGVGIRRIAADGTVTTLPLPAGAKPTITGVSVWGSGASERVFAADRESLIAIDLGTLRGRRFLGRAEGGRGFGIPDGVAALGPREVAFTDAKYHAVRIFRDESATGGDPGSVTWQIDLPADAEFRAGGYADGDARRARFNGPRGIAAGPRGQLVIADAGNRRVRVVSGFDARIPVEAGDAPAGTAPNGIALVGGSSIFYDTVWDRSVAGQIERRTSRRVTAYRYRDGSTASMTASIEQALRSHPEALVLQLTTGDVGDAPDAAAAVARVAARAKALRVRFTVVCLPIGSQIGEGPALVAPDPADERRARDRYERFVAGVNRSLAGAVVDAAAAFRARTQAADDVALSAADDRHLTDAGAGEAARAIATALSRTSR